MLQNNKTFFLLLILIIVYTKNYSILTEDIENNKQIPYTLGLMHSFIIYSYSGRFPIAINIDVLSFLSNKIDVDLNDISFFLQLFV